VIHTLNEENVNQPGKSREIGQSKRQNVGDTWLFKKKWDVRMCGDGRGCVVFMCEISRADYDFYKKKKTKN